MHTFFINDLIQLCCLRHVSNNQVFIIRKTAQAALQYFFTHLYKQSICCHRQHIQSICCHRQHIDSLYRCMKKYCSAECTVFLMINTWLFETCRRQHNWIKSLMKKVCILLVLLTYVNKKIFPRGWTTQQAHSPSSKQTAFPAGPVLTCKTLASLSVRIHVVHNADKLFFHDGHPIGHTTYAETTKTINLFHFR